MSPLNETFKALSDKTRRQILKLLRAEDLTAGEIADHFDMTKPSISHHLNILKQSDLISDRRQGQNIYYSLNTSVFEGIMSWILEFTVKQPEEPGFQHDEHDFAETPKTSETKK
ncbi:MULTISPECIES: autorepressor SdpR family transcription factor [Desulfitobacterium]|uniref:Putative transcriptional regulator n=1 Tax=Desulfitobacterium dehalogenans (strain ATCC 51507 / DSM 9161 / JW/IU-DC1) TaxID=756499 RepID=I4ADV3_DESDJ|nr:MULTISPECIES: autorepressor SdpR family transcription factor [Desulfitobacterium]AFM02138.1 putative transcriptional regulator [Desulfitobacterium dehalogenans ATCC 51507]